MNQDNSNRQMVDSKRHKEEMGESAYDHDMHSAITKLHEAESDMEAEYIADYYGFEVNDLLEAYQASLDEDYAEKLEDASTPGNGLREALGLVMESKGEFYADQIDGDDWGVFHTDGINGKPADHCYYTGGKDGAEADAKKRNSGLDEGYPEGMTSDDVFQMDRDHAASKKQEEKENRAAKKEARRLAALKKSNQAAGVDMEEGVMTGLAGVAGGIAGGAAGAATPVPGGAMIGRALGAKAAQALVDAKDEVDDTASDEEKEGAIAAALDPQTKQKVATTIGRMNPAQIKAMMNSQDNQSDPLMEHKICEEVTEIDEATALKLIRERLKYAKTGKGLEAKESFNADVKLSTPKSVVTQLTKKYGHPDNWQIAEAPEGSSYYVLSGAIPETQRAKELEKSITSLDEEITSVREKYGDVKDEYRLPQEIKIESMRKNLEEMVAGHKHQVARWLTLDEASALITLAHKWSPKG